MSEQEREEGATTSRRGFIGASIAALAGLALVPGVRLIEVGNARAPEQGASSAQRWGLLIDTNKCAKGCNACVTACNVENGIVQTNRPHTDAQWIRKVEIKDKRSGESREFPVMCQHCEHPPCVDVCPTGASFKRADGIVLVDKHICIGCRYCMMACPYKARSFIHEPLTEQKAHAPRGKGCVESCTLCVHRVDEGGQPACTQACAAEGHAALLFGDLNDPSSEIAQRIRTYATTQLRADLKLNPGVRYQGL
jgi:molybdopterin-containing oxidoreductase family iron-sulfur binding subunit